MRVVTTTLIRGLSHRFPLSSDGGDFTPLFAMVYLAGCRWLCFGKWVILMRRVFF